MVRSKLLSAVAIILALPFMINAQADERIRVKAGIGTNLSHSEVPSKLGMSGQFGLHFQLIDELGLETQFRTGKLNGKQDKFNRNFNNNYLQTSLLAKLNLVEVFSGRNSSADFALEGYSGLGIFSSDAKDAGNYPKAKQVEATSQTNENLPRPDYTKNDLVIPFGGTFGIDLTDVIRLDISMDINYVTTDKMDTYLDSREEDGYDLYSNYSVSFSYLLF